MDTCNQPCHLLAKPKLREVGCTPQNFPTFGTQLMRACRHIQSSLSWCFVGHSLQFFLISTIVPLTSLTSKKKWCLCCTRACDSASTNTSNSIPVQYAQPCVVRWPGLIHATQTNEHISVIFNMTRTSFGFSGTLTVSRYRTTGCGILRTTLFNSTIRERNNGTSSWKV